jgi:cation:H+ antiporter
MFEALINNIPNTLAGNAGLALVIAVSVFLLCKGADLMVDAAVEIARDFGLPKLIIGATIVSLGTTAPEACVSVLAAIKGNPGLAMGNGIGSVICDLALILGLTMTMTAIPINPRLLKRQSRIVLGSALLLYAFTLGSYLMNPAEPKIHRPMGMILIAGLAVYLYISYRWARQTPGEASQPRTEHRRRPTWIEFVLLLTGLGILIVASEGLIPTVTLAAVRMGISQAVIAATLVALGTSLPELMTAISAVRKGHPELTLGNILGADALNILFVIGASSCAVPLQIEPVFYMIRGPVMIGLLIMFQLFVWRTENHFKRWQGVLLLIGYGLFISLQYLIKL